MPFRHTLWIIRYELEALLGDHISPFFIKATAITTYVAGTIYGGFWMFAQVNSDQLPGAIGTFLASAGPAGALVWFLIWHIGQSNKRDDAKDERHSNNLREITETFKLDVRDMRQDANAREDLVLNALKDNTKALVRIESKCPITQHEPKS